MKCFLLGCDLSLGVFGRYLALLIKVQKYNLTSISFYSLPFAEGCKIKRLAFLSNQDKDFLITLIKSTILIGNKASAKWLL